jgi:hypothetical protein
MLPKDQRRALEECLRAEGKVQAVAFVRSETGCGLREAVEYVDSFVLDLDGPPWDRSPDPLQFGEVVVVDRAPRTIIGSAEVFVPYAAARQLLPRPPDFEGPFLVSWGTVEEKFISLLEEWDPEFAVGSALEDLRAFAERSAASSTFWSLYYRKVW